MATPLHDQSRLHIHSASSQVSARAFWMLFPRELTGIARCSTKPRVKEKLAGTSNWAPRSAYCDCARARGQTGALRRRRRSSLADRLYSRVVLLRVFRRPLWIAILFVYSPLPSGETVSLKGETVGKSVVCRNLLLPTADWPACAPRAMPSHISPGFQESESVWQCLNSSKDRSTVTVIEQDDRYHYNGIDICQYSAKFCVDYIS